MKRLIAALLVLSCVALGCADDGTETSTDDGESGPATLVVPDDFKTIQAAVDATKPGDMVYIKSGIYKEKGVGVTVETENIVLRGEDRNKVIIDGEFTRDNGIKVFSNGVAIENMTLRNHNANGVFFTGEYNDDTSKNKILSGYRVSYVTAYNNGLYGVYGFNATKGQFDHSYASGHPDAGYYIGQCNPCDSVISEVESENNMLGYSGTNSTGVTIVNSYFHDNRSGLEPNSLDGEKLAPNAGTVIVGNRVIDNKNASAPNAANKAFDIAYGNGIVIAGTTNLVVERNLVTGHSVGGIVVTDLPDGYKPENNKVRFNNLSGNEIDLVYVTIENASNLFGNCFEDNEHTTTFPENLEAIAGCGAPEVDLGDLSPILQRIPPTPAPVDWKTVEAPPDQDNMPNARDAKVKPATDVPMKVDVDAIKTPTA